MNESFEVKFKTTSSKRSIKIWSNSKNKDKPQNPKRQVVKGQHLLINLKNQLIDEMKNLSPRVNENTEKVIKPHGSVKPAK